MPGSERRRLHEAPAGDVEQGETHLVAPDGRPHVTPLLSVWLDDTAALHDQTVHGTLAGVGLPSRAARCEGASTRGPLGERDRLR